MFTGIIEEVGKLKAVRHGAQSSALQIQAHKVLQNTEIGDSIAVNGVCLTVTSMSGDIFEADVMAETLRRTNLGDLVPGSILNLERALSLRSRLGGHIVSGHIDGTGTILSFEKEDNATWITIGTEPKILKYIIEKGSIAIDGVSLTVAKVSDSDFAVSIIPHTSEETILLKKKSGDTVNLENDIIGKYVEKLLSYQQKDERKQDESQIDLGFLAENGFL